ncbi:MAG: type I polyketide synthase [Betaproteobacteria bacterium]|nr:type I polyketide synthase [Betaproteobacteria bacterium]
MTASYPPRDRSAVAIVGIGCRLPGGVVDAASFWRLLAEGRDAIGEIPADRVDLARFYDPRPATPGRIMTRWGGFLEKIEEFDALFFGISPREAERLDPQQRLALETAWEALEDAGQDAARLEGSDTGVYIGQWLSDFEGRLFADPEGVDFQMTTGSGRYATSGRLSYCLGLHGPSLTLDTACSSSLVAVHLAASAIRRGDCSLALAGGVNVILQPHVHVAYSQSRMMAPDGRCKFGDAAGDGYVRSEGAALVVLKPLEQALADGDRIYAVIRGGAINNDGRSSGSMGTPSRVGQEDLLRRAYRDAGIAPARVGYAEAHGTGTRAGDPVELTALGAVLGEGRTDGSRARVGSVKTNIGHTEGAAGVAGLIKAALALHHGTIPASLHCRELNPAIAWSGLPLEIARQGAPWPRGPEPRVAGVSAFGIAGTNAHIVMEEAPAAGPLVDVPVPQGQPLILPLSARSPEALRALAARHADLLASPDAPALRDLCWSAATRRTALSHRAAFVAADVPAMVQALRAYASGEAASAEGIAPESGRAKVAFVAPGQGAQWNGMGRELMAREPVFRAALEACDRAARPWIEWSIVEQLALDPGQPGYLLDRIDVIQPILVALAIAYAELLRSKGIEPDALAGHSLGEVAAACVAGAIDLGRAMQIVCRRSALMNRSAGRGAMALVELTMAEARKRLAGREDRIDVAGDYSPRASVISGEPEAVKAVLEELGQEGVFCRLVKVNVASHSPQMDPHAAELATELAGMVPSAVSIPMHSTVLGRQVEGAELDAGYWARNLRQAVMLRGPVEQLVGEGVTIFVELGPHPVLLPFIQQTAQAASREVATLICGRREQSEVATLLAAQGGLWAAGFPLDWGKVLPAGGCPVDLPSYPWQRERLWVDAALPGAAASGARAAKLRPDDVSKGWLHRLQWLPCEPVSAPTGAGGAPWVVVSRDPDAGKELAQALARAGSETRFLPADQLQALSDFAEPPGGLLVLADDGPGVEYLPLQVLQALPGDGESPRPRLWFVTRGGQSIRDVPTHRVHEDQAALWGAARAIGEEHPELWGGLVDLDPDASLADSGAPLARHLGAADGEDQVALRGSRRHALRLARDPGAGALPPVAWRPDAAYLVTGGLGVLAPHIVRDMAAHGARRVVLLGRTPMPPRETWEGTAPDTPEGRRIRTVRDLEAAGLAVHLAAVDAGDAVQLKAFLDDYRAQAWPPIRGVIHAAGTQANRLASTMDSAAFDSVLQSKLAAARNLDRLLPDLDHFVMFSSIGSFLLQGGDANYAAANAGLDALALDRRARGLPALSIAWGRWEETGLVASAAGEGLVGEMERQGLSRIAPAAGAALFSHLCAQPSPIVVVLPMDWAAFGRARAGRAFALFRELMAEAAPAADKAGLAAELSQAAPARRRQLVEPIVRECVGRVLKILPARLDPRKALGTLGLNSLMAMELRNRLETALGRSLPATLVWNYPTVEALAEHLAGNDAAAPGQAARQPAAAPTGPDAPAVTGADLLQRLNWVAAGSDDDAAQALRAMRPRKT